MTSKVLATYIANKYSSLAGQSVLELGRSRFALNYYVWNHPLIRDWLALGAGTGLVGLVAGKLGARVVVTDQKSVYTSPIHLSSILNYHRLLFIDLCSKQCVTTWTSTI